MLSSAAGGEGGRGGEPVVTDTLAAASAPAKKRLLTRSATVPHSMTMPTSVSVEVCARVKPMLDADEKNTDSPQLVDFESSAADGVLYIGKVEGGAANRTQSIPGYKSVILPDQSQAQAYAHVVPRLQYSFLNGYNCTLFVYGQTGSGKTHTLFGPPNCFTYTAVGSSDQVPESWGMFPRCAMDLLAVLRTDSPTAVLNISVVEIYQNICYDLLNDKKAVPVAGFGKGAKSTTMNLETLLTNRRDKDGKWVCPYKNGKWNTEGATGDYEASGQKVVQLRGLDDILRVAATIDSSRSSKSHKMNLRSSRSHCVITLTIGVSGSSTACQPSTAKFLLVDLAGSERIAKSGVTGMQEAEARNVNSSLSALGRCVQAVARREKFIPFRDSVLTMLMKQSLGGNCHTTLIVTVCEDPDQLPETISSLGFGRTCSTVTNRADNNANFIKDRPAEVRRLKEGLC
mmetsp:Transcript_75739/g.114078  ORF Transcript_75739/g.114078 Transcript_75739/m.114078 type:complete len:457 (+) Transcript_75739:181-1551(+)